MTRHFEPVMAPHIPSKTTVGGIMLQVLLALVPAVAAYVFYFGPGILIQMALASSFAVAFEALMLRLRGRPLAPFLSDYSAVVTAVLFALCIPPLAPWWISLVAMAFAIIVAKHLFGGLGNNIFNPAMVGYVVVLISFPQEMTQWLLPRELAGWTPGLMASLESILSGTLVIPSALAGADAVTGATPLDTIKTGLAQAQPLAEIRARNIFGDFGGLGWEWIANWYLLGGLFLLYRRVISWHVPVATLGAVVALGLAGWLLDPAVNPQPLQQLFSGGLMLAAFFIATDPVSGCASPRGRLIFGAGVGIITLVIRRWGGYPDGIAFAVLLMNSAAPLIDRYTRPRVYGR